MPGLFGILLDRNADFQQLQSRFVNMQKALNFLDYPVEEFVGDCVLLGAIGPHAKGNLRKFSFKGKEFVGLIDGFVDSVNGNTLVLQLDDLFRKIVNAKLSSDFLFLSSINGEFNIVIYCIDNRQSFLLTDRFAFKKIYRVLGRQEIYFFPDFAALKALPDMTGASDLSTIADHILFTHPLNNKTFRDDVKLLPNASIITIDRDLQVKSEKYWQPSATTSSVCFEECADNTFYLLKQAVIRKIKGSEKVNVSLSGGLDSRILAAISVNKVATFSTTYGYKKSHECLIAKQVANSLDIKWHHESIDENYIEHVEKIAIRLNDGMAPAEQFFHLHAIDTIMVNGNKDHCPNLSGFYGDLLLGGSKKPASSEKYDAVLNDITGWLVNNLAHNIDCQRYSTVFSNNFNKILLQRKKEYLQELANIVEKYEFGGRGDLQIDNVFVLFHARRYLSSLCQYSLYTRDLKPFFDYDFFDYYLSIPVEFRLDHRLYFRIINKFFPEMAKITYASTGNVVGRSPTFFFKKRKEIYNSVNYRLGRLTKGKLLLNDPYNYVQLAKWHFANSTFVVKAKDLLLEEQTLDRGILNAEGIAQLYFDYKKGLWVGNILLNLYFLEKWFRVYLDGEQ